MIASGTHCWIPLLSFLLEVTHPSHGDMGLSLMLQFIVLMTGMKDGIMVSPQGSLSSALVGLKLCMYMHRYFVLSLSYHWPKASMWWE